MIANGKFYWNVAIERDWVREKNEKIKNIKRWIKALHSQRRFNWHLENFRFTWIISRIVRLRFVKYHPIEEWNKNISNRTEAFTGFGRIEVAAPCTALQQQQKNVQAIAALWECAQYNFYIYEENEKETRHTHTHKHPAQTTRRQRWTVHNSNCVHTEVYLEYLRQR